MKVTLNWIKEFVAIDRTPAQIVDILTMAGLEVEEVIPLNHGLEGVVVGEVISLKKHPNADKLTLCDVCCGDETIQIICGAPNVVVGSKVPVALLGAKLPGNSGKTIEKTKIRGELSLGMICSEAELGVGENSSGIMMLDSQLSVGDKLSEALGLQDVLFDISVTPNRGDCLSIIGIAREIAA
ncbi:MAG: phenylalanine--tRNA ligase subunit beta, partial [Thermodesulfobacteriota bacterium]|nr:phenylalanine--tRNA ligase subunit beta [Thermodesulfobacteriota bacterium]